MTNDDDDHPFSDSNYLTTRGVMTPSYPSSYTGHHPLGSTTEDGDENKNNYNPLLTLGARMHLSRVYMVITL